MTTPNRDQIIRAHEALERLERAAWKGSENEYEEMYHSQSKDIILSILPPKPAPTMDEIEWDDDKHFLAEANHPSWGRSAMLGLDKDGWIKVISWDEDEPAMHSAIPCYLVPTGKRYTLAEVQE